MAFSRPRSTLAAILLASAPAYALLAADEPNSAEPVVPMTKELLLKKVPNFFYFDYPFDPQPGKRIWLRIGNGHFIERYPDGTESLFKIVGYTKVRKMSGTIVSKEAGSEEKTQTTNTGSFQMFIPDKDTEEPAVLFRQFMHEGTAWLDMSWSQKRKTIMMKAE